MAFQRDTLQQIIDRVQPDLISRLSLTGAVLRRAVVRVLARVIAGASYLQGGYLDWISRQILPDTSDAEILERQASAFGVTRIAATFAAGTVDFTGTDGTLIPAGTELQRSDGALYVTDADATIAGGVASAAVTALIAGDDGNADAGTVLDFVSPVAGADAQATVDADGLTGGTDAESDDALRARLLERMRNPPHGGAASDYVLWAKEVAGVTRAWAYPNELGLGTVTVRFMRDNDPDPIPDAAAVAEVQAYIDGKRPIGADPTVAAPVAVPLDLTIALTPDTAAVRAAVEAELRDLLLRDAEPGGTILLSRIREAISIADGESDNAVIVPAADVTHNTGEIAVLGTITWA